MGVSCDVELDGRRTIPGPSYKGLRPASRAASKAKRMNRRVDTGPELALRRELWRMGLRFHKNVEEYPGKPDLILRRARVAVFCDGDFWHGRDWPTLQAKLERGTNPQYWVAKIATNMARDTKNTAQLEQAGWRVLRLWESDIKKDASAAAQLVAELVSRRFSADK